MSGKIENPRFDTVRIHSGYDQTQHQDAASTPIYQSAAFDLETPERADTIVSYQKAAYTYTRVNNPTVDVLEQRIAALDGGSAALAFASGSAAVFSTLLLLGEGGGNIVATPSLYGAIQEGFVHFLPKFGIEVRFVDSVNDFKDYERLIDDGTKAVYVESLSNPTLDIPDLEAISRVAHAQGVPVLVDNTVPTPYLFHPFEHGADIILYSATKGLSGHGNTVAGLVVESGRFDYDVKRFPQLHEQWWKDRDLNGNARSAYDIFPQAPITFALRVYYLWFFGAKLSPFDAYLVLLGLDTLSERIDKESESAKQVAEYLRDNPHVRSVNYPNATDRSYATLAAKYFPRGLGYLLSFEFDGTAEQQDDFVKTLNIFQYEANLGDVRSLIVFPTRVTHAELEPKYLQGAGIDRNLVRVSIGLEDPQDLIDDLDQAFHTVFRD